MMQILLGLNESYSQIQGQILLIDPLPSINKVYSLLIQDERQKSIGHSAKAYVESIALSTKINIFGGYGGFRNSYGNNNSGGKAYKNNGKERPMCSHCGTYHIMEECYKLHGYPPGYKAKGKKLMGNQVGNSKIRANFGAMDSNSMPTQ